MVSIDWVDPAPLRLDDCELCPTVGVEEEFVLIDPDTGAPFLGNTRVVEAGRQLGIDLQLELSTCQIETATPPCTSISQLRGELVRTRRLAAAAATEVGARLLATGVAPMGPLPSSITDVARYRRLAEHFGQLGEQVICGCHVHVGIPDRHSGVAVCNYLRQWLPALLALAANSPIIGGRDTGYASWRHMLWSRWPSAGPPPHFDSATHYDAVVAEMLEQETILDTAMLYWDVRLSAHLPTIEIRVADVPATADDAVLVATLIRGLVATAFIAIRLGSTAAPVDTRRLRAAYWRAARDGIDGRGIDPITGHLVPAKDPILRLLDHIRPALERTGDYQQTQQAVQAVFASGNGAVRQRRTFRTGTPHDLLDMIGRTTLARHPTQREG
ncbi:carboxylate-amine ligase [Rhodococcus opacus]|uniref:carboxylate-amine ligase n=1 Tax=Rhodococcus opacus TaxID=37919 RepID=UPI001C456AED|nr:glutamate--cysteine ligase [Rhodococcus opacus]MBV6757945.1 glutamate--cysteine ligase [Rhodococcus opacus]